jgi:hypothetical protein
MEVPLQALNIPAFERQTVQKPIQFTPEIQLNAP